ncbi:hypothetical protein BDR26DRAFT_874246 [Obelidium mucronatum]|nr:hypothetical protein BDR26DRAFT_874246 [Obelidium mucronatum]
MSDKNGRYIIAFKRASNQSDGNSEAPVISSVIASADYVPHVSDIPLGYLYYVCCMEDSYDDQDGGMDGDGKAPVIYCMELQLIPEARNTGLGSIFMNFHEQIGLFFGLRKSMLTVFKKNEGAMRFYKRLGYSPDNISPSMCMTEKRASRFSYEIMKKDLKRL